MTTTGWPKATAIPDEELLPPQAAIPDQLALNIPLSAAERSRLERCERVIAEGRIAFMAVGTALNEIRDQRLWRDTHKTFEAYCRDKWDIGKSQVARLIDAVEVITSLANSQALYDDAPLPRLESHARPLAALKDDPERLYDAWRRAVDRAGDADHVSAALVQEAVDEILPPRPKAASEQTSTPSLFEEPSEPQRFAGPGPALPLTPGGEYADEEPADEEWQYAQPDGTTVTDGAATAEESSQQPAENDLPDNSATAPDGTVETDAETTGDGQAGDVVHAEDAPPPAAPAPAASKAASPSPLKVASPEPSKTAAPAAPAPTGPPPGWTTALVKVDDLAKAQAEGLWPLAVALETLKEARDEVRALRAESEWFANSRPPQEAALASAEAVAPPTIAMALAGSTASRLAEMNNTGGTVLYATETHLLDELFPQRTETAAEHIVAVLVVKRLREMTGKE